MPRATGIQVLGTRVRAVELRGAGKSVRLASAAEFEADPAAPGFASDLRRGFAEHRIARDPAVLLLGASSVRIRSVPAPFQKEEQIRRVLKTILEEHLHGVSSENVVASFCKVCDLDGDRSRVIALSAEKRAVSEAIAAMNAAGIDPQVVESELSAIFNWACFAGAVPAEGPGLIVDIEPERVALLATQNGRLAGMRSFRTAIGAAVSGQPSAGSGNEGQAGANGAEGGAANDTVEKTAPGAGSPGDWRLAAAARLSREILRFTVSEGVSELPAAGCATGSLSTDPDLLRAVSELAGFPVAALEPPPGFEGAPAHAGAAAGAALKLLGTDCSPMDFRQEELAFRRKFDRVKWTAVALSLVFFMFFSALGANFQVKYTAQRKKHARMVNEAYLTFFRPALPQEKIQGYVDTGMREMRNALKARMEKMTGPKGQDRDVPQIQSALTRWKEMADRIRSAQGVKYLTVDRMAIEPRSFSIEGEADSAVALDSILNMVKSTPGLDQALFSRPPKLEGEKYRFGIRADVREQEAPK